MGTRSVSELGTDESRITDWFHASTQLLVLLRYGESGPLSAAQSGPSSALRSSGPPAFTR